VLFLQRNAKFVCVQVTTVVSPTHSLRSTGLASKPDTLLKRRFAASSFGRHKSISSQAAFFKKSSLEIEREAGLINLNIIASAQFVMLLIVIKLCREGADAINQTAHAHSLERLLTF
jgi:hypothetical protein